MKSLILAFTTLILVLGGYAQNAAVKNGLKISWDKHYLVDAQTGRPVFILATTDFNINELTYK